MVLYFYQSVKFQNSIWIRLGIGLRPKILIKDRKKTTVTLAPTNKKPTAGSTAKLGTGAIGKPSSQIGKTSSLANSSKQTNIYSSGKSAKPTGADKTASFFGASPNNSYFGSSGKSNKTNSDTYGSYSVATGKSSNVFGTSAKANSISESSGKQASIIGSSEKSYNKPVSPAYSAKTDSSLSSNAKNSNVLGTTGKYSNAVTPSPVKNESKPIFSSKPENNSLNAAKSSNVFGSSGKYSNTPAKKDGMLSSTGLAANILLSSGTNSNKLGSSGNYSNVGSSTKKDGMATSTGKAANVLFTSGTSSNVIGSGAKYQSTFGTSMKNDVISKPAPGKAGSMLMPNEKLSNASKYNLKENKSAASTGMNSNVHDPFKLYPSFIKPKESKSSTRLGILWLPLRKRNKKKDMVHHSHNYENYNRAPSMHNFMSGDSSEYQSNKKKEEESLLVPERAKLTSVAVNTGITAASIDMPPDGLNSANPEEKQEFIKHDSEESKEAAGDTNEGSKIDKDFLENNDNLEKKPQENKWNKEKQGDLVDSVYLRPPPPHKARSATSTNEDEGCGTAQGSVLGPLHYLSFFLFFNGGKCITHTPCFGLHGVMSTLRGFWEQTEYPPEDAVPRPTD
ncbi:unnamed protein product [Chilo suppressalis]|uniref:Uncharacterized protein n=1 Tax=Chilo suppressalis TaxID=168631 RepID=A0ABN8B2T7_CHISP|nr:unnamed protein product [Chilo suppressalis]